MLARLAELDLLRRVRTLSCVSGGSIAGSIYYLTVLSTLADPSTLVVDERFGGSLRPEPLTAAEATECVRRTHAHLVTAATANIRALVFKNPAKNLLMYLSSAYSRTDRAGDMIDRHLCRQILRTETRLWRVAKQLELRHLHAERNDVPRLVLNATTLNSGHSWRFTTAGMGEILVEERRRFDKNDVFAFTRYPSIPAHQRDFPLGLAVAASACFPILFRPLPVSDLYPDTRVDLMDGGAQDNQGIQALLDEHEHEPFERIIVSDGAGQLEDERVRGRRIASVIQRVIGVQGDRIREEQLLAAEHRLVEEGHSFELVDLRHGITRRILRPFGEPSDPARPRDLRESLASIRTDLDAFGTLESELLVAHAYRVASALGGDPAGECPLVGPQTRQELAKPSERTFAILQRARRQLWKPIGYWLAVALVGLPALGAALYGVHHISPGGPREVGMWSALVGFAALPGVLARALDRRLPRTDERLRWGGSALVYAALLLAAALLGPALGRRLGLDWSGWEALGLAGALLLLPALAPCVVWLLLSLEGRVWRRLARTAPE